MHKTTSSLAVVIVLVSISVFLTGLNAAQDTPPMDAILESVTFRPVDEILTDDLTVTNFASDGTASLPIKTTIPVACTIVYGKTPDFGTLAVDLDMNGSTHTDHNPLLTNLEPETTYYFRVQGTDDSGIIYLSEVMTLPRPRSRPQRLQISRPRNWALKSSATAAPSAGLISMNGGEHQARWIRARIRLGHRLAMAMMHG